MDHQLIQHEQLRASLTLLHPLKLTSAWCGGTHTPTGTRDPVLLKNKNKKAHKTPCPVSNSHTLYLRLYVDIVVVLLTVLQQGIIHPPVVREVQ